MEMDSLRNTILQWVNCLYNDSNYYIKSIMELENGEIYYKLIKKIKSWSKKENITNSNIIVHQFIKDEYPNVLLKDNESSIENFYIAILVLSRLSLEPIFHKSLCMKLPLDMQVKIKSILESLYTLGKDVTVEDLSKIMSFSDKIDIKSYCAKPQYLLEEFFNSPITQSIHNDNKLHEQTRQLRNLRAKVDTLDYEKLELIEDIKIQRNQIQELQNKLHKALSDLKTSSENNFKTNLNCSCQTQNIRLVQSTYEKEVQSLEIYLAELQNDNLQLQDKKNDLLNEIKIYKAKCCMLEERNINNEQILESTLLQIEKKEDELIELKIKYEELYNYLKEKYKMYIYNESFDLDDKGIPDISLNKSETLSSVIEIQLQDTTKELITLQNKYKTVNILLTIIMEEYKKLKGKVDILQNEQHNLIENQSDVNRLKTDHSFIKDEIRISFTYIFLNYSTKHNKQSQFLDLLNLSDNYKSGKGLKNHIIFKLNKKQNIVNNLLIDTNNLYKVDEIFVKSNNLNSLETLKKYRNNLKTNQIDNSICIIKFDEILNKENDVFIKLSYNIMNISNTINVEAIFKLLNTNKYFLSNIQKLYKFNNIMYTLLTDSEMYVICIMHNKHKNNKVQCLKHNQISNKCIQLSLFPSQYSLKSLKSTWIFLFESIHSNLKIYKVLLLLEKNWILTLEILKDIINYNSYIQPKLKQLLIKKDLIESELKNINFKNLRTLSVKLIIIVQFVTMLTKNYYNKIKLHDDKLLSNINLKDKIINIKKQIDNFNHLLKLYKKQLTLHSVSIIVNKKKDKSVNVSDLNENKSITLKEESIFIKDVNTHYPNKLTNVDTNYNQQFQHYLKEIHDKYELKLEKMKEKMKSVYINQITTMKKEQEISKSQLETLESKIKYQYYNHTEELKKYKKHISELTKQLWHIGDKLINEKQEKDDMKRKMNYENNEIKNKRFINHEFEKHNQYIKKSEEDHNVIQSSENYSTNKMDTLRGFQIMGNAFNTEDEEGEVFDTTYLSDMHKIEHMSSIHNLNRLSILQMRNSKCKPHLKSSYSAELQFHPIPFTEDEIKTGSASEDLFNDSLSQSLLTGKKVKRKDRTRNAIDTPRRSRRFSNIFRKHRLSTDRK